MELPQPSLLNFFNKILISLEELTLDGSSCSITSLLTLCKSVVHGGQRGDYDLILKYCKYCGLLKIKNGIVEISLLGTKWLEANRERYFEINEAQKQLIVERIVFKGVWNHLAREIFENFYVNQSTAIYEFSMVEISLSTNENNIIHFFKFLGILHDENSVLKVDRRYSELVYQLTADSKAVTEQQLEKILMENRKLGAQAENAVVEFEKTRLKKLGKFLQADLVKRISTINVAAGYDIESLMATMIMPFLIDS